MMEKRIANRKERKKTYNFFFVWKNKQMDIEWNRRRKSKEKKEEILLLLLLLSVPIWINNGSISLVFAVTNVFQIIARTHITFIETTTHYTHIVEALKWMKKRIKKIKKKIKCRINCLDIQVFSLDNYY